MKIKKVLTTLSIIGVLFGFTGCDSDYADSSRFYRTGEIYNIDGGKYRVIVDRATENIYLVSSSDKVITPLFDKDGKIAKYNLNK